MDPTVGRADRAIAWGASVFACLYLGWCYAVLARHTEGFRATFAGLGAELPASTAFVLDNHRWLYPAVFVGAAVLVLLKEAILGDKRVSVALTFTIALVIQAVADYFRTVFFAPLLGILERLG